MIELNTFYNEDCLETLKKIQPKSVHCVLTSPPYNMTKRKGGYADKQTRYDVIHKLGGSENNNNFRCKPT
jgi:DNA modification methylase